MLVSFSIAVIGALAVTLVHQQFDRTFVYGIGLITYIIGYFILRFMIKYHWFPYYMVLVGYLTMIVYIVLHGGGLHTLGIFFLLLFIFTALFMLSVYVSGFIVGLVGICF